MAKMEEENEIKNINESLQDIPFEKLLQLRSQGFTKKKRPGIKDKSLKRGKKDEPIERSAKIPVRAITPIKEKKRVINLFNNSLQEIQDLIG